MDFLKAFLRNLLLIALVIVGMLVFAKIFYPDALSVFPLVGKVYSGLNLWPIIVLGLLLLAWPRRRRRRR
jgi:hypothetical protein